MKAHVMMAILVLTLILPVLPVVANTQTIAIELAIAPGQSVGEVFYLHPEAQVPGGPYSPEYQAQWQALNQTADFNRIKPGKYLFPAVSSATIAKPAAMPATEPEEKNLPATEPTELDLIFVPLVEWSETEEWFAPIAFPIPAPPKKSALKSAHDSTNVEGIKAAQALAWSQKAQELLRGRVKRQASLINKLQDKVAALSSQQARSQLLNWQWPIVILVLLASLLLVGSAGSSYLFYAHSNRIVKEKEELTAQVNNLKQTLIMEKKGQARAWNRLDLLTRYLRQKLEPTHIEFVVPWIMPKSSVFLEKVIDNGEIKIRVPGINLVVNNDHSSILDAFMKVVYLPPADRRQLINLTDGEVNVLKKNYQQLQAARAAMNEEQESGEKGREDNNPPWSNWPKPVELRLLKSS